ncbi:NAD(P)H-binding protein [Bifidobacterium gallicum]|nr:NAD(P)H-binding protein [Bifidobacterium gallicum]KFI58746.1 NAD-dependent dehydratase [Bifidobacterium gallicum DSM 20093 = LMG 11596]
MRVFVAGASGRVGTLLTRDLVEQGNDVVAASRHPEQFAGQDHVTAMTLDLHAPVEQLAEDLHGVDAVYFVAGSRGKDLLQTDAFGAVKLMMAVQQVGIKRFILLSSMFADEPSKWDDPNLRNITNYNIAKFFADQWLMTRTDLNYTIVQPCNLVEEPATGKVAFGVQHSTTNSIGDVAAVLAAVLDKPNTYRKIIMMSNGDIPIAEAVAQV